MHEMGVSYYDLSSDRTQWINDYIQAAVWYAVEHWATDKVYTLENELDEEYALANAYWHSPPAHVMLGQSEGLTLRCLPLSYDNHTNYHQAQTPPR